jgi:DNA polymerase I-like protein with 3'-5' exonuclease and polymerase domains
VLDARVAAKQMGIPRGPDVGCDYFLPNLIWKTLEDQDYCLKDCYRALLLWVFQQRELERQGLLDMYCREMRVLRDTLRIQRRGVRLLEDRSERMHDELETKAAEHEREVIARAARLGHKNFNPRSHVQLKTLCFDTLSLPVLQLTEKKQPSTNADVIEQLGIMTTDMAETGRIRKAYAAFGMTPTRLTSALQGWFNTASELFHHLEHYRSSNTRRNYTRGYLRSRQWHDTENRDGYYVFTNLNPWGTATTRFSSSDENLQNIDKELLRLMFGPPPGWQWISADFDQLEIRLMCRTSLDPTLNRILRDGLDRHQMTADLFGVPRALGKAVNFAWQYGAGAPKLGKMLGVSAAEFVEQMRKLHPGIIDHQNEIMDLVRSRYKQYGLGFVYTLFGYRLTVPISSPYVGINYEVQGSAGDILKYAVTACMDYIDMEGLQDDIRIILTVHDEILFECRTNFPKKHLRRLREIMSATGDPVGCPTPADMKFTTTSWGELKELAI